MILHVLSQLEELIDVIENFNGKGYHLWKHKMLIVLLFVNGMCLESIELNVVIKLEQKGGRAFAAIILSLKGSHVF